MTHRRTWVKRLLSALVCSLFLLACSPAPPAEPPPTPTPGPLEIIKALESAWNQGDTDAALDLFVDEGLDYRVGVFTVQNKDALGWIHDGFHSLGSTEDVYEECQSEGEEVTCTWSYYDGICLEAQGLEVVHFRVTFTFEGHKIRSMSGAPFSEERPVYQEALEKWGAWAAANRPEEWRRYENAVALGLTGRRWGEIASEMCRDYLEATSQ